MGVAVRPKTEKQCPKVLTETVRNKNPTWGKQNLEVEKRKSQLLLNMKRRPETVCQSIEVGGKQSRGTEEKESLQMIPEGHDVVGLAWKNEPKGGATGGKNSKQLNTN